jgi:predicted enzyme related to lactoylglutathione lyase
MSEVKSYKPGTFCWADLATTDPTAAKSFYAKLFGWTTQEISLPGGGTYTIAQLNGGDVAGISRMMPDQQAKGIPPYWSSHVAVASVDESAKNATTLGGKILAAPMDVMDVGRMAVIQDPSGAALSLWQAKKHIGAARAGEHGALIWNELSTRNVDACGSFYTKLFGWGTEAMKGVFTTTYTVFKDGAEHRAGMMPLSKQTPANVPSRWAVYFGVNDCDATASQVTSLGGKTAMPPTDIPNVGRFSMFFDPQGAFFAVLQPAQK